LALRRFHRIEPQQFGRFIDAEITKWTKIAKDVGVKAE
jgi:hypothetical protein